MKRVLVIEDDPLVRANIVDLLEAENYDVQAAENGKIGVDHALKHPPDIIVCDIMMPEMDGYQVMDALRTAPSTQNTPFIFLSAMADKTQVRQGMDMGADDYLTKPFKRQELLSAIVARLDRKARMDEEARRKLDSLRSNISLSLPQELHAPLASILGTQQLLLELYDSYNKSHVLSMIEKMHKDTRRLQRLVQNFLLYARLELLASDEAQIRALRSEALDQPGTVIGNVATNKAKEADRDKDLKLELADVPICVSDTAMAMIISELVDNALKFSLPGTPVQVKGEADDTHYLISVIDQGPGLASSHLSQISPFIQFERRWSQREGTGFGLTLAKRMAELYDGELILDNWQDAESGIQGAKAVIAFKRVKA